MRRRRALPLAVPRPFATPTSTIDTRDELVDVLSAVGTLHEIAKPEEGTMVVGTIADWLAAAEPRAPRLAYDVELAVAVGFAVHRFEALARPASLRDDDVDRAAWNVIAWAAMEQAGGAPDRHVPWIAYGVQVGYYVGRKGRSAIRAVHETLDAWLRGRCPITHSALWEGRLVADFGTCADSRLFACSYLPLRPLGTERLHDQLLFEVAWDDFSELHGGTRMNGTPRLESVFPLVWKPAG